MKKNYLTITGNKTNFYSLVLKLRNLSSRIDRYMKTGKFWEFTKNEQQRLINKLNRLYQKVAGINTRYALKIAGAAMCFAFISSGAKAQTPTFRAWQSNNPFEISSIHGYSSFTPRDAAFADVDGDGDDDAFIFITESDEVAFFENVNGVFTENSADNPFLASASFNQGRGIGIDIADFDDDGDLDAIIINASGIITHFELVSNDFFYRNYSSPINSYSGSSSIYTSGRHAKFSDIDGDGDIDILTTYSGGYYISSYLQQPDGTFSPSQYGYPIGNSTGANSHTNINLKDMDGDGDDDLFIFNPTPPAGSPGALTDATSNIIYYENTSGSGNFILNSNVPLPVGDMPSSEIPILVDLDGDGDTDIFLPGLTSNSFENLTDSAPTVPVSPFIAFILFAASGFGILRRNRKKKKE